MLKATFIQRSEGYRVYVPGDLPIEDLRDRGAEGVPSLEGAPAQALRAREVA